MKADCHMHMALDGVDWKQSFANHRSAPNEKIIHRILSGYQRQGYTYLRDGGDRWGAGMRAKQLAPQYAIVYKTPLSPLCKEGHYGSFIGTVYRNFEEYAAYVKDFRSRGADFIKIMISGLMDFDRYGVLTEPGLDPKEIYELIHIAHEEGMTVMAHANGARTVEAAAAAGVESVEHGAYLDDDALGAMEQMGTVWVPTLSTIGNLRGKGRFSEDAVLRILESAMENLSRYSGFVAPGSDAGAWAVPHDADTEQELLLQAGITRARQDAGAERICQRF